MTTNPRVFLWLGLVLLAWLNFETWTRDYAPAPKTQAEAAQEAAERSAVLEGNVPQAAVPAAAPAPVAAAPGAAPAVGTDAVPGADVVPQAGAPAAEAPAAAPAAIVHVETDVLDVDIGLVGGELRRADLLAYPLVKGQSTPVRLFNRDGAQGFYVMQTGLAGAGGAASPTHLETFTAAAGEFRLAPGQNELRVPLTWTDGHGVTVTKTFVFGRGRYNVALEYSVRNDSDAPWSAASYAQILRDNVPVKRSMFSPDSYAFKGPAYYDGTKYQKLKLDDKDDQQLSLDVTGGWIAGMQHHFVTAVVPPLADTDRVTLRADGRQYLLSTIGPTRTVAPRSTGEFRDELFMGPKLQAQLETTGPELERVADYGMLTPLAKPLFILLKWLHKLVGNWGWAIVLATCVLKILFYPLSEKAGKSMAKMKTLAPRIKNLQELYKDDREKLGRAMMKMYQDEKINPVAGCLPILIQMPVFLAFYWVLLESVEMRQAPFMLWINDLSTRDPFFVLPAIMAAAMFGQYKLNPAPPDPVQAKVFMIMPFAMSVMFAFFPAGLVLYWVTNTLLSIAQQWNINRRIARAG
ncbi:MAG: membrane protein insertase YidC [Steroidobacteraceae bacterium]|nr:membrane protein insertase YidC [Steroidobacteraceae bacterium]MCW5572304.1 membrane protein insertase YidC [Steroidobacteraceae bacterium]